MANPIKKLKRKPSAQSAGARPSASLPKGVKVVAPPKSAFIRDLLTGRDISTSGGNHTTHSGGAGH
jgi:hypothetical protein